MFIIVNYQCIKWISLELKGYSINEICFKMISKRYLEHKLRNHSYFIFFFCIGLFFNLDLSSKDVCEVEPPQNISIPLTNLPKAGLALTVSQKSTKKLVRPRYYSTELGIREKLFVGVLTTPEQIDERTIAINRTVAHLVDKIKFFMSASHKYKPAHVLSNVVGFTDKRESLRPFHVIKYIADGFSQNYDYFFLMKDSAYINARTLKYIANKISVSQHVYMGTKLTDSTFCSLDAGILLSNSVVTAIMDNLDWCVKNSFSDNHSENLGRCIARSAELDCQEELQGQTITSFRIKRHGVMRNLGILAEDQIFNGAVTIHPVSSPEDVYTLHAYHSRLRASRILIEEGELGQEVVEMGPNLPEGFKQISWPVGRRSGAAPVTRFDVMKHIYFNMTHKYFYSDYSNVEVLNNAERIDIKNVLEQITASVRRDSLGSLSFRRLINGYRLFDLSRGLDYTFDLGFKDLDTGKEVIKRFKACKPLGNVEILAVPYVTENGRVTILVTVREREVSRIQEFVAMYVKQIAGDRRQKTFVMLVLVYEAASPSKGDLDVFKDVKKLATKTTSKCRRGETCKVAWLSIRLPSVGNHTGNIALKLAAVDLGLRKIGLDSLVLVLDSRVDISGEFLNRVRMNTIAGFQMFNPIPFGLYNPLLTEVPVVHKLDIHKSTGQFVAENYDYLSFYGKDYVSARLRSETVLPIVRGDRDIKYLTEIHISDKWNLFRLFVKFGDGVHCMRATDPGLKLKFDEDLDQFEPFASKAQLAKAILLSN